MAVLERSELEASPLADLHAIAGEMGLEGFRRLRKADLIDTILGEGGDGAEASRSEQADEDEARPRRRRTRSRRRVGATAEAGENGEAGERGEEAGAESAVADAREEAAEEPSSGTRRTRRRGGRAAAREEAAETDDEAADAARIAAGVVEVLGNGSAFLRVDPPEPSDDDVYISAAQVRRCELVSGDRVTGPVRTPRRSERYPSLVRIDTINGEAADRVSDGSRYDELPVQWPSERILLGSKDPTLEAIEHLTPLGRGSRAVIVGGRGAGKSETLRRIADALAGRDEFELTLVLAGARPEEVADWQQGPLTPAAALTFAAAPDTQSQAIERALDGARRVAARGGHAVVLIDGLDGVPAHAARKALAAARSLRDGGSLTLIATASEPLGGETTVIALDATLTTTGRQPILDLVASATLRPELLVGERDAAAIVKARAELVEAS